MTSLLLTPRGTLLGRALRLPLGLIPKRQAMTVRSGINSGFRWIVGSSTHGCWLGTYEHDKQELVRRLVRPGMKVLDIGANAGYYTLAFSRLVGEGGRVWAFEPLAGNVHNLLRHVEMNSLRNVTVVQAAVSDRPGIVGFNVHESNAMGGISSGSSQYRVPAIPLDALVRDGAIEMPDFVKMDVEGAEALALAGAQQILERRHCTWLISLHGADKAAQCEQILRDAGYDVRETSGEPVSGPIKTDEIFAVPANR